MREIKRMFSICSDLSSGRGHVEMLSQCGDQELLPWCLKPLKKWIL